MSPAQTWCRGDAYRLWTGKILLSHPYRRKSTVHHHCAPARDRSTGDAATSKREYVRMLLCVCKLDHDQSVGYILLDVSTLVSSSTLFDWTISTTQAALETLTNCDPESKILVVADRYNFDDQQGSRLYAGVSCLHIRPLLRHVTVGSYIT